tara:strand:+ start:152 stop:373 length:222 start_codon:yes stop_codon:yes gene_type:complete
MVKVLVVLVVVGMEATLLNLLMDMLDTVDLEQNHKLIQQLLHIPIVLVLDLVVVMQVMVREVLVKVMVVLVEE